MGSIRHREVDLSGPILCRRCGEEKLAGDFYPNNRSVSGLDLAKCKDCAKAAARERRFNPETRERVLAYDRARGNRQTKEYRDALKARRPDEHKARTKLGNAVRDGRVNRPDRCSHCHKHGTVHGHHHDYTRPLDVVWLCVSCHRQLHAFMDTVEAAMGKGTF